VTGQKVNGSSARRRHLVALVSVFALGSSLAAPSLLAQDSRTDGASATVLRDVETSPALDLPSPPDVVVTVEGGPADSAGNPTSAATAPHDTNPVPEPATAPPAPAPEPAPSMTAEIAIPAAPEVELSQDLHAPAAVATIQQAEILPEPKLDLPEPPVASVVVNVPATPALRLPVDEAGIRTALDSARQRYRLKPSEIDSIAGFYAGREFRPVWLEPRDGGAVIQPRLAALSKLFADAEQDGLDAIRLLSALPARQSGVIASEKLAETDLAISLAALLYARDARGGRIDPTRLSAMLTPELELPNPAGLLEAIAELPADGLTAALYRFHPQHAGYRALRAELAKMRESLSAPVLTGSVAGLSGAPQPAGTLPPKWLEGAPLAFGKPDPRVPHLRIRLGLPTDGGDVYDLPLRKAVEGFQRVNGLTPNGRISPKTRIALENPQTPLTESERKTDKQVLVNTIIANMERWRWLPAELGEFHVFVNVPDFRMQLVQDGKSIHETRVIVGKPQTQTPVFSDEMEHLIVNPSWGVPPSILKKEFLPKLATDPDYARRRGFEVVRRGNSISIRQPPGERNALGFVKFMFPNSHSVYLHDTPNRSLFANDFRAYSHGCVRVDKPFAFAEKLLSTSLGYSEGYMRGMIGRGERMIRLPRKIPVHLSYFTVFVDDEGNLQERRDLYGHDARVRNALQL
jgi:murein L,D-transpeptidase YcbB/YkuD